MHVSICIIVDNVVVVYAEIRSDLLLRFYGESTFYILDCTQSTRRIFWIITRIFETC